MSLATVISSIFEPMVVLLVVMSIGGFKADLVPSSLNLYLTAIALGMFLPTMLFRYWLVRTKKVGNWDITNRKQRIVPLAVLLVVSLINIWLVIQLHNAFLTQLFIFYFLWFVGFFVVTLFFKLSGHVGIVTLAAGLMVLWYGPMALPLSISIPLVAWARIKQKAHTMPQTMVGALYSCLMVWLFALANSAYLSG
jgi:hypothetical protein